MAIALGAKRVDCPPVEGRRGWAARIVCEPSPKGNSKKVLPVLSSRRCRTCGGYEKHQAVPRSSDVAAEKLLARLLSLVAPPSPITCDVELTVSIRLPIRRSWSAAKKRAAESGLLRPTSSKGATGPIPDLGNLEKLLDDALEKGGWVSNDSVIAVRRSEKIYHAEPGYEVTVRELPTWSE